MKEYTNKQIEDTLNLIASTIRNCEKMQSKFKEGISQLSLLFKYCGIIYVDVSSERVAFEKLF